MEKKKLIILISVGAIVAGGMATAGYFLGTKVFKQEVKYVYDTDSMIQNYDEIYANYKSDNKSNYINYRPHEVANIAILNLKNEKHFRKVTKGSVIATGVEQKIRSNSVRNDDFYMSESLSYSSLVQVAFRAYMNTDESWYYDGAVNANDITTASWNVNSKKAMSHEDYKKEWGKTLDEPVIYIISSKTVKNTSTYEKVDGGYNLHLVLNPQISTANYITQMVRTSNLSKDPIFYTVDLYMELNEDLKIKKITYHETYDVYKIIWNSSVADIVDTYFYEEANVPEITENCDYGE